MGVLVNAFKSGKNGHKGLLLDNSYFLFSLPIPNNCSSSKTRSIYTIMSINEVTPHTEYMDLIILQLPSQSISPEEQLSSILATPFEGGWDIYWVEYIHGLSNHIITTAQSINQPHLHVQNNKHTICLSQVLQLPICIDNTSICACFLTGRSQRLTK